VSPDGWGYNYDHLKSDLITWNNFPYVTLDSIGSSAQDRALWMLTITSEESEPAADKFRIAIHARTHPREIQTTRVVNEIITFLTDTSLIAQQMRQQFIFNIVPMYNPDGVELGCERVNANGVDLEGNFNLPSPEPEAQSLKSKYLEFMSGDSPIKVALNLHSSINLCRRFFYYHSHIGTSPQYANLEQEYINYVQAYFPGGIADWDFLQSWTNGTPSGYPESFFWLNYGEQVLALTYEDINDQDATCPTADKFDSTAMALVQGSVDYINSHPFVTSTQMPSPSTPQLGLVAIEGGYEISGRTPYLFDGQPWRALDTKGRVKDQGWVRNNKVMWNKRSLGAESGLLILRLENAIGEERLFTVIR
jgi:hypothetical protein